MLQTSQKQKLQETLWPPDHPNSIQLSLYNFQTKSKMYPLKWYTSKEAINHKVFFIRSQPQGYYKLINNIQMVGNLIYNYKLELKRVPRKISQIDEPPQGGKASLKFVMIHCSEGAKLVDKRESSYLTLIRYHREGLPNHFKIWSFAKMRVWTRKHSQAHQSL